MAVIEFVCPVCSRSIKASESLIGKPALCPKCKKRVDVPGPDNDFAPVFSAAPPREASAKNLPRSGTLDDRDNVTAAFSDLGNEPNRSRSSRKISKAGCGTLAILFALGGASVGCIWIGVSLSQMGDGKPTGRMSVTAAQENAVAQSPPSVRDDAKRQAKRDKTKSFSIRDDAKRQAKRDKTKSYSVEEKKKSWHDFLKPYFDKRNKPEPLAKPASWDEERYDRALWWARTLQKTLDGDDFTHWAAADTLMKGGAPFRDSAAKLLPNSFADWRRELLAQAGRFFGWDYQRLHAVSISSPCLIPLRDDDLRDKLKRRAPLQQRKELFAELRFQTKDLRKWSLHHPFDDLDASEMKRVIAAAKRSRTLDLVTEPFPDDDLKLLLRADQLEFLSRLVDKPLQERHAENEADDRQQETEAKARQAEIEKKRKQDREKAVERVAQRQREERIAKEEKKAKKLLDPALRLHARGGFDKQVKEKLREVIEKYPDTPSAEKAQQLLDKMSGKGGSG